MHTAEIVLGLVVLASAVTTFAERLGVPAPSLLVLAGLGVGLIPGVPAVHVTPEIVSLVVLPPLLYSAAVDVVVTDLLTVIRPVAMLAVGLVVASAVAVAYVAHWVTPEIDVQVGLVLGAVLASTDPVAVSALARRLNLPARMLAVVQGESLLNDATSLLLFQVVVTGVAADHFGGAGSITLRFIELGVGGAALGITCAVGVRMLHERINDPVLEAVIAILSPYAIYVVAQVAHTSGVTAVVFGGLYLGRRRYQILQGPSRLRITQIYDVVVFLLESAVFAIIGLELPGLVRDLPRGEHDFALVAAALTATLLVARLLWVTGATFLPGLLDASGTQSHRRSRVVAVVSWAGTRGVVPLAAALSIPLTTKSGAAFPHRVLLLVLTSTCTAITLVVQGLSLRPVVQRAGVVADPQVRTHQEALARHAALAAAMGRLQELQDMEAASSAAVEWLTREFRDRLERAESVLRGLEQTEADHEQRTTVATREEMRSLRRELIAVETSRLHELVEAGQISESVRRKVQRMLDLDESRATD
ncbi:MAG TPA: Na+/H+ antiporter [Mycobacteriales bacterium]|nr:Na+/H+ antiporter [Mycobacteriales bacterium]